MKLLDIMIELKEYAVQQPVAWERLRTSIDRIDLSEAILAISGNGGGALDVIKYLSNDLPKEDAETILHGASNILKEVL